MDWQEWQSFENEVFLRLMLSTPELGEVLASAANASKSIQEWCYSDVL